MNLAKQRIEPDFVVSALFNVCNDYDPAISALTLWEPQHHSAATESDGDVRAEIRVSGRGNPYWETHSTERTILVLLGLVDVLCHQDRKPLLAELIEIASRSGKFTFGDRYIFSSADYISHPKYRQLGALRLQQPASRTGRLVKRTSLWPWFTTGRI